MNRRANGEGTVRHRADGRWEAVVSLPFGGRKSLYAKTQRQVLAKRDDFIRALDNGDGVVDHKLTVASYLQQWIAGVRPNVRGSTFRRYSQIVRRHLVPRLGRIPLRRLTPADCVSVYAAMVAEGLAPRTAGHAHRVLGKALRDAEVAGFIVRNVVRLARPPRVPRTEMKTLSASEARTLLGLAAAEGVGGLYAIALTTGARQGELLGLKWSDVDWAASAIRIQRALVRSESGFELTEPKTASSVRSIPFGPTALEALRRHRKQQAEDRLCAGAVWSDLDLVFPTAIGTPIDAGNLLRRTHYPLLAKAGLPRLNFHALRHSAATLLLVAGVHPRVVAERLGHSTPSVTLNIYSHVTPTMQREAATALDAVLGGG